MAVNGNIIKQLRKEAGLTQSELGKKIGVVKQTISSWENNISEPNSEILTALSKLFGVSISQLYGNVNQKACNEAETPPTPLTEREQNIIDIFRNLTDDNKDIIVGELKKTLRDQRRYEDTDLSVADDERITAELNNPNFKGFSKKSDAG